MEHALALLSDAVLWKKMGLTWAEMNQPGLITSLLSLLISESQALGGSFLNEFWQILGKCHPRLEENIIKLNAAPESIPVNDVSAVLFRSIPASKFDCTPIICLAAVYFTHLGLTFMTPRDPYDPPDVDRYDEPYNGVGGGDVIDLEMDVQEEGLSDEQILKYSAFNRDGFSCVITGMPLEYPRRPYHNVSSSLIHELNVERCPPLLTPVIPLAIKDSPAALQCIAVLAGDGTRQFILNHLFTVGNSMVLDCNARSKFDDLLWTVEASVERGTTRYIYRRVPTVPGPGPLYIKHRDGSEVEFGKGRDGERLGVGPLPELCRLRLAVTRVLRLSGASRLTGILIDGETDETSRSVLETVSTTYYLQLACSLPYKVLRSWRIY